jgi:hypothetical protein
MMMPMQMVDKRREFSPNTSHLLSIRFVVCSSICCCSIRNTLVALPQSHVGFRDLCEALAVVDMMSAMPGRSATATSATHFCKPASVQCATSGDPYAFYPLMIFQNPMTIRQNIWATLI